MTVTMMAPMTAMIATPATHNEDGEDEHKPRRHVCLLECVCVCVCECVCMRVNKGVETWSVCGGLIVGSPIYELITNPLTLSQSLHSLTHSTHNSLPHSHGQRTSTLFRYGESPVLLLPRFCPPYFNVIELFSLNRAATREAVQAFLPNNHTH